MHDIGKRHDKGFGIVAGVEIRYDALFHPFGRAVCRHNRTDPPVLLIADGIQRRHIHALDLRRLAQKLRLIVAVFAVLFIQVDQHEIYLRALAEEEHNPKIRDRLGIAGARSARHHQRIPLVALLCAQRQPGKVQHIQHGGIAHLILQRKPDKIKHVDRVAALERKQRQLPLPHQLLHIRIGHKHTLAPDILPLIEQPVEDLHPEMGHPHLIQIRKTKGKPHRNGRRVFDNAV